MHFNGLQFLHNNQLRPESVAKPKLEKTELQKQVAAKISKTNSISMIDSIIVEKADSSKYKWILTFDSNGYLTFDIQEKWEDSLWGVNIYQRTYTYNSNGNMTSEIYKDWYGNQWTPKDTAVDIPLQKSGIRFQMYGRMAMRPY